MYIEIYYGSFEGGVVGHVGFVTGGRLEFGVGVADL